MAKVKPQISARSGLSQTSTRTVKYQTSNEFTVVVKRSEAQYVTLCLELGVAGCGDSLEDALADTREAIESYVESMQADNLSPWRPVPVQVLHEFLAGESGESPSSYAKGSGVCLDATQPKAGQIAPASRRRI
jgi:predicted RNase H-like HicB family nuclease